jgi:F0F1-type ATP synthase assembly protein I
LPSCFLTAQNDIAPLTSVWYSEQEMTKKAAAPTTKSVSGNDHFSLGTLASDLMDTAWRIAVPVLLFAGAGIFVDSQVGSEPWCTLLGTVIGFIFAGLLVKKQLAAAAEQENEK